MDAEIIVLLFEDELFEYSGGFGDVSEIFQGS